MTWNVPGTSTDLYARAYIYAPSFTLMQYVCQFRTSATAVNYAALNTTTGKLLIGGSGGVTGTYVPVINTWYQVEAHINISATVGYTEAYLYSLSGTQLDYITTAQNVNTSGVIGVGLGQGNWNQSAYYDSLALSDLTWCGPAADVPSRTNKRNSAFLDIMG